MLILMSNGTQKITGTREAFSKMLEERNICEKLGVKKSTVSNWKKYLQPGGKGITKDKMEEMLTKYGAKIEKDVSWVL